MKKINKILLIEQRVSLRAMLHDAVKSIGAHDITVAGSLAESWSLLEKSPVAPDLLIMSMEIEDTKINSFHILGLILEHPKFKSTNVLMCLAESDKIYIPALFELGVVSYIVSPFARNSLADYLSEVVQKLTVDKKGASALCAASFLRKYLIEIEDFSNFLELERSLISALPDESELLLNLGEALFHLEKEDEAMQILRQASLLGSDLMFSAKRIAELMGKSEQLESSKNNLKKIFGVDHVLIIDNDKQSRNLIEESLEDAGVANFSVFDNGEDAVNWLSEGNETQLIILEWRIPKLPGPQFLQRLRQQFKSVVPVLICSSLLEVEDHMLIKEMGANGVLSKPVTKVGLVKTVVSILRQDAFPKDYKDVERKIRALIEAGKKEESIEAFKGLENLTKVPPEVLLILKAEINYLLNDFETAKVHAVNAFKITGETVDCLNIMGKVFLKLGERNSALKCLSRASSMNTKNLRRLCELAQVNSELGNHEGAAKALDSAENFDGGSALVKETKAGLALNTGDPKLAKKIMQDLGTFDQVLKYMNNRAVLLAKEGEFETSLDLYKNAVRSLPDNAHSERDIILYNLGMALARKGDALNAADVLKRISKYTPAPLHAKTQSLLRRVQQAVDSGKNIEMKLIPIAKEKEADFGLRPVALHVELGHYGVHNIFDISAYNELKIEKFMAKRGRFSLRVSDLKEDVGIRIRPKDVVAFKPISKSNSAAEIAIDDPSKKQNTAISTFELSTRILVVDTDASSYKQIHTTLKRRGFENIGHVKSGEDAWSHLINAAIAVKPYGLVFCESELLDISGFELLERIRKDKNLSKTPFMLMADNLDENMVSHASDFKITGCIAKPFSIIDVQEKLESICQTSNSAA